MGVVKYAAVREGGCYDFRRSFNGSIDFAGSGSLVRAQQRSCEALGFCCYRSLFRRCPFFFDDIDLAGSKRFLDQGLFAILLDDRVDGERRVQLISAYSGRFTIAADRLLYFASDSPGRRNTSAAAGSSSSVTGAAISSEVDGGVRSEAYFESGKPRPLVRRRRPRRPRRSR